MEGFLMEVDASRYPFGFVMDVVSSTRRPNAVKKIHD